MVKTSTKMVSALLGQWRRMHALSEVIYAEEFLPAMRAVLPGYENRPEFRFIARRVWMDLDVDDHPYWDSCVRGGLVDAYHRLEVAFDWSSSSAEAEPWVTPQILKETLSFWQERVPHRLSLRGGLYYLHSVGRLADAGVEV